jgi:hypothetical protein
MIKKISKLIALPILLLTVCIGCNDVPGTNQIRVTVLDADSWSPDNIKCSVVDEALVLLLSEYNMSMGAAPGGVSDETGVAIIENRPNGEYFIKAEKDSSSNVLDQEVRNGNIIGYVVIGVVKTMEEAESLPLQFGKRLAPGDVIILDTNSDGIINKLDKTYGNRIDVSGDQDYIVYIVNQETLSSAI